MINFQWHWRSSVMELESSLISIADSKSTSTWQGTRHKWKRRWPERWGGGGHYRQGKRLFKKFPSKGAAVRGKRLIEGRLLFPEVRNPFTSLQRPHFEEKKRSILIQHYRVDYSSQLAYVTYTMNFFNLSLWVISWHWAFRSFAILQKPITKLKRSFLWLKIKHLN